MLLRASPTAERADRYHADSLGLRAVAMDVGQSPESSSTESAATMFELIVQALRRISMDIFDLIVDKIEFSYTQADG